MLKSSKRIIENKYIFTKEIMFLLIFFMNSIVYEMESFSDSHKSTKKIIFSSTHPWIIFCIFLLLALNNLYVQSRTFTSALRNFQFSFSCFDDCSVRVVHCHRCLIHLRHYQVRRCPSNCR